MGELDEREALERARQLITNRRRAEAARNPVMPWLMLAGAVVVIAGVSWFTGRDDPNPYYTAPCNEDHASCHASKIAASIQAPCSRAIESQLMFPPTWHDSSFGRRFDSAAWYDPPRALIFYGRSLTVSNALGAELRPHYFCVTTRSGTVLKAGIPDLP